MKKNFLKTGAITLTALLLTCTAFVGCTAEKSKKPITSTPSTYNPNNGGNPGIIPNPNPTPNPDDTATIPNGSMINVKCVRRGFDTDWLFELKDRFEKLYADKGYKINIIAPDGSLQGDRVAQELAMGYDQTSVDLYITVDVTPDMVGAMGDYGILVEDIGESVYNQKAISYDGTKEEKNVSEKLSKHVLPFLDDETGATYGFNWVQSTGGMVVNTRKLALYGLEIPKTTNEMLDCFDKIYCGYNDIESSSETKTYPITYVSGGNSYTPCFLQTLIAQYDAKFYDEFWSFQKAAEDGTFTTMSDLECMETYNDPAILETLKVAYQTFDCNIAAPGSFSQGIDQAQAKIMNSSDKGLNAVFMFNGDWMLNEVKINYSNLDDIDFINYPVISALGTKLFGKGTAYNLGATQCDELLSYIIGLVDENKELDEIIADVKANEDIELAEEDAAEVARARGVSYSRGVEHLAYITKNTPNKALASLFLRMMASDDFGKTFQEKANASTPYYAAENTTSQYAFVRNASKIPVNRYFSLISLAEGAKGYRKQLNLHSFFTTESHVPDYIASESTASIYDDNGYNGHSVEVYKTAAEQFIQAEITNLSQNWDSYKESAGLA